MDKLIPYGRQWIDNEDIQSVVEILKGDWITQGSKIAEFEGKVAKYCQSKYAVAVSSGTAALHAACCVSGIKNGDEVITTPITFFGTVASIIHCGATPVLADIKEDTVNIDPNEILQKITKKTKAIVPVDFAGHPVDIDEIKEIASKHNIIVIEDACHALGAEYKGRKVGSLSDMTVFSFHPVKSITTGEGGMILTNNEDYYKRLLMSRNHNIKRLDYWHYDICEPGYNYRLTDLQCALGISQIKKLDKFINRRREMAQLYNKAFKGVMTPTELSWVKSAYHLYVIRLQNRDRFMESLATKNIGTQIHYKPTHLMSCMKEFGYREGDFPKAEEYYHHAVSLPIFPKMTDEDVEYVITMVNRYAK